MKKIILLMFSFFLFSLSYGQKATKSDNIKIRETITGFLNWYKINEMDQGTASRSTPDDLSPDSAIVVRKQIGKMMMVGINMKGVERRLRYLKSSTYLSDTFINDLRAYYQKIANELKLSKPYPASDEIFAIGGLTCDVIFGCEPEDVLDSINEGKFTKIYMISNKAIVRFSVGLYVNKILTLTKVEDKWLIDSFAYDHSNN